MTSFKQFLFDKSNKSDVDQYFDEQAKFLIEKQKLETIDNFNGYFDFLNNDYGCDVYYDGLVYKSVSYAYQAARSTEQHIREKIVRADTLGEMYEIASKVDDPADWGKLRLKVMEMLIRDKFKRNSDLREKLKATENRKLINSYGDATTSNLFWGMVDGEGQNQIGRILEGIRNDIHQDIDLEKWLFTTFKLENNKNLLPKIQLDVLKGDEKVETAKLEGKEYYFMGKLAGSDVLMAHGSISRRHAALICGSELGVCIIDLGSKAGSFLNKEKAVNCVPCRLKPGDILNFGGSTRSYKVSIDYSDVESYLTRRKREMKRQVEQMDALNNPEANPNALKASLGVKINDQIFVAGLPENAAHKDIQTFFSQFGEVKHVRIPIDKKTGKTKPFGIITFKESSECEKAIKSDGIKYKEKRLKIKWAEKRGYDDYDDEKRDRPRRDKYAEAVKENRDRVGRDVEKRHGRRERDRSSDRKRRSRERDSRRRDKDRRRSKERSHKKRKSESRSSSRSGSESSKSGASSSKERSREREKEKDRSKKADLKKDEKKTEEKSSKRDKSKSRSRSRSSSAGKRDKKRGDKNDKDKRRHKKEGDKKRSRSKSDSSSDSGSDSSPSAERKK